MKELILRLVKDRKIVGYLEIQCNMEKENPMMAKFTRRNNALKTGIHPNIMLSEMGDWIKDSKGKFDSFDMGIKVGDEWLFTGNLIRHKVHNIIGEIIYFNGEFEVDWTTHNSEDICISDILHYHNAGYDDRLRKVLKIDGNNIEHIGTIYDGVNYGESSSK